MRTFSLITFYVLLLLLSGCARNPVTGKKQLVLMSEKQEIAMGQEADPQIVAAYGLYEDKTLQDFINQKGQEMARISHRNQLDYTFRILDSPIINAFALPGGYVYFTRGIMAHFNNEAEFAGVLGHEIGHITARHSVAQQRNSLLSQLGLIAGVVLVPEFGQFADEASQGLSLMLLKFGRDAERQSDALGVEYSSKIGYDASEMAGFFNTLERNQVASGAGELPEFLSTHPSPAGREAAVAKLAEEWKAKLNLTDPRVNRDSYLKMLDGLVYGEDPRQGFLENRTFYHPELKFEFAVPAAWSFQNTPQQVQMAEKQGKAMMTLTLVEGSSLQEASSSVLKQYVMELVEAEEIIVNGLKAIRMEAGQQQQETIIKTLSYVIEHGGFYYNLMGITHTESFDAFESVFLASMNSFRELKDTEKLNRKPERIRLKTVASDGTLQQVLSGFGVAKDRLEEVSLINGMSLSDPVRKGTLIKVLEQ
ncbi:MAG TPA: M48 family metalloprotease [Cyclobacteriaceae bacterium]|nr:M48 family metalloprotease [Cyclobacteriaceae bacterium]